MPANNQQQILTWMASGQLQPEQLEQALKLTESVPSPAQNLRFLSRVVLVFAVLMLCSGIIFFFAYNWDDLTRYHKFAIAQAALILVLLPLLRVNLQQPTAQAALFAASLLVGALLALVGQTYQSGADTYQLFLVWAVLITPWAVLAAMPALYLLLLALLNISLLLALDSLAIHYLPGPYTRVSWALLALNGAAAILWLLYAQRRLDSRLIRWTERAINMYCLCIISSLAIAFISSSSDRDPLTLPTWLGFATAWLYYYRLRQLDLIMLSALIMASIVLAVTIITYALVDIIPSELLFLLLALSVIGLSSAGAVWLKTLSSGEQGAAHD